MKFSNHLPVSTRSFLRTTRLRKIDAVFLCGLLAVTFSCNPIDSRRPDRGFPNILLIVADDLGFSDLGCYGGEIHTPNLDQLAESGIQFTNFYSYPTCSPTRAALLTGADPHLAGLGTMAGEHDPRQLGRPGYEGFLNQAVITIPAILKDAGYQTYMAGKWHLGMEPEQGPHSRGFDQSFALLQGGASHFGDGTGLVRGAVAQYRDDGQKARIPDDFYSSAFYTDKVIEYLGERSANAQPFFAYLAFTAPHWPLQVPDAHLHLYRGEYRQGFDYWRQKRIDSLRKLGIVGLDQEVARRLPHIPAWDNLTLEQQERESRKMEIYAAMVERMDYHIGRLFQFLKDSGTYENTLICFLSDNGPEGNPIHQLADNRSWIPEQFDNSLANMGRIHSYIYPGPGWSQVSAAPFNWFKAFPFEGGIRVPCIVKLPGASSRRFQRSDVPLSAIDIAPTLLDLVGVEHPAPDYRGKTIHIPSGKSMLPLLEGNPLNSSYTMGWELFGRKAFRWGDWKILFLHPPYGDGKWRLFNLRNDPAEQNDLSQVYPGKLVNLLGMWEEFARDHHVIELEQDRGYANEDIE